MYHKICAENSKENMHTVVMMSMVEEFLGGYDTFSSEGTVSWSLQTSSST